MAFTAVQMIGTQRSGSNLLRLMLNQLGVSAPHPPHILERFMPLLPLYGDLTFPQNFKNLINDACRLVALNPVPWNGVKLNPEAICKQCKENTLIEITRVIYEEKAKSEGACIWMCKSMTNIHFADELEIDLQPLYIFLYRDGRDVACSFKKAVVGEKHIYNIAKQWKEEQDKCLALQDYLGNERIIAVCYENLIADPQKELKKICSFIGAEYHSQCLQYYRSDEAKNTASSGAMWQNVEQNVLPHNYNKYCTELSQDEIALFENVAGDTLLALGYQLQFPPCTNEPITRDKIGMYSLLNKQWKQEAKLKQTPEDAAKRKPQDALLHTLQLKLSNLTYSSANSEKLVV